MSAQPYAAEELMSVSHKTGVTARSEKNITMFMAESYVGHKLCRPGDIVVNTMWAWMAAVGVSRRIGIVSPSYGVYRPRKENDFRAAYARSAAAYGSLPMRIYSGFTRNHNSRLRLYPDDFLKIIVCSAASRRTGQNFGLGPARDRRVQRAIEVASREISLLREFRSRLIADVVTGKLDVREAAARLPEEAIGSRTAGRNGGSATG